MSTCFVDSTTLLYPLDPTAAEKRFRCAAWLKALRDTDRLTMSLQVLNESYWVVQRKPVFEPVRPAIRAHLEDYAVWATAPLDRQVLSAAWQIEDRYGVRFWDALLLASANGGRCAYFLSEDLNDGQAYGDVQAINPFRHAPEDVLGRALR